MSGTDDRIINMQFDNAVFEKNLASTMRSIETLQKSLDFQNAASGIDKVNDAASKFSMEHVSAGIEGVSTKFLALTTIGITALTKITGAAIDAGKKVADAFIIDPAKQGFHEYETKIGSIQTILANTARYGTQLPEVASNLDKLNDYADKTIYSFGDMTKNIGLFTNAGIKVGDATSMIKGFSNAAAASGTTADGAAGAAYQLSQALSAGQIRLMDWRSLTNVGMGNKNMQDSLIQLAQSMGVFNETGDDAKEVAKDFNGSLESGWLKADVMSKYLKIMSGEMSDAEIASLGLSKAQVEGFKAQQKTAEDAATKVRTFTQLVGTIKESVGSAWAQVFEDVVGDFTTATDLFTGINNVVGGAVKNIADSVDKVLKKWAELGGRKELIDAFKEGFKAIGNVVKILKDAFREFFPAKTATDLKEMTDTFAQMTHWMIEQSKHLDGLKTIFRAFFAVIDIGWNILKQLYFTVLTILDIFTPLAGGVGGISVKFAEWILKLHEFLIEGGKLEEWGLTLRQNINKLAESLKAPIQFIGDLKDKIVDFFSAFAGSKAAEDAMDRVHDRLNLLKAIGDGLVTAGQKIMMVLDKVWDAVSGWFKELGSKIAAVLKPGDFDAAVDVVNIGLLGGIIAMLKKFLDGGGIKSKGPGFMDKIKDSLDQLTGTLKAMETELKAKALMEISIAIGVLAVSLGLLSLISPEALTKAMIAVGVGFGILVEVMKQLDKLGGEGVIKGMTGAMKLDMLSGALIALATASVILGGALLILGTMSWDDLLHGLAGMAGGLAILIGALKLMSEGNISGVVLASAALVLIAGAMVVLGGALKIFATMSWEDIAKGLVTLAGALAIIVVAVNAMPFFTMIAAGLAMIPLATGIAILAGALKIMATMSWEDIGKGLLTLAGILLLVTVAMNAMPIYLPLIALGLIKVAEAIAIIAGVLVILSMIKMSKLLTGLLGLGGMMVILAVGLNAMAGAVSGAIALGIAAVAIGILGAVLIKLSQLDIKELLIGLGALAALLTVLGLAALLMEPVIPALIALGVALGIVGVAFALFGIGAFLIAKAFETIAAAGKAGTKALIDSLMLVVKAIPAFTSALISSLLDSAKQIIESADLLLRVIVVLLGHIIDSLIELVPKIAVLIVKILDTILQLVVDKFPEILTVGYKLLQMFLQGIINNIVPITQQIIAIVVLIAQTLTNNAYLLVNAAVNLMLAFIQAIGNRAGDIAGAGLNLLMALIGGIAGNLIRLLNFAADIIIWLATGIVQNVWRLVDAGANALVQFLNGLGRDIRRVLDAGANLIINIMQGVADNMWRVIDAAFRILTDFLNALASTIRNRGGELRQAGLNVLTAIMDGMTGGIAGKMGDVAKGLVDGAKGAVDKVKGFLGIHSPSAVFADIGGNMMLGLINGIEDARPEDSVADQAQRIVDAFAETLSQIPDTLAGMDEMNPVITPILDLSQIQSEAGKISSLVGVPAISADVSFANARLISTTTPAADTSPAPESSGPTEVNFEQNIYSPTPLSANDIYRQTKSQIVMAKEELDIS